MSEELKEIARLRKAMQPLLKMIKDDLIESNELRYKALEKKLESLTLQQPQVNVEPPVVNIPPIKMPPVTVNIDTEKLVKAIQDVQIKKSEPVRLEATTFEPHDQSKDKGMSYAGFVRSDGAWYIQRVVKGEQRYARGTSDYRKSWEKRTKLAYGDLDA